MLRWMEAEWYSRPGEVKWGDPVSGRKVQGVRASIGAMKHGNACRAKGSRKVNE